MFGDPEFTLFSGFVSIIVMAVLLLLGLWVFSMVTGTKTWKSVEKGSNSLIKWHDKLPYTPRRIIGWLALVFYCLSIITLFIWMES